jgi:hypothetical protein
MSPNRKDPRAWKQREAEKRRQFVDPPRPFTPIELRYLGIASTIILIILAFAFMEWLYR